MIKELLEGHWPEWIEAMSIIVGAAAALLIVGSVALYKLDDVYVAVGRMEEKMDKEHKEMNEKLNQIPLIQHEIYDLQVNQNNLATRMLQREIDDAKSHKQ